MAELPVLASVASVFDRIQHEIGALPHVLGAIGDFLDGSRGWTLERAASTGSLRLLQRVVRRLDATPSMTTDPHRLAFHHARAMRILLRRGDQTLVECGGLRAELSEALVLAAVEGGNLVLVQRLLAPALAATALAWKDEPAIDPEHLARIPLDVASLSESIVQRALKGGHLGILRWLWENHRQATLLSPQVLGCAAIVAAKGGDLAILEWLHEVTGGKALDHVTVLDAAARSWRVDVLHFVHQKNRQRDSTAANDKNASTFAKYANMGNDAVVDYLREVVGRSPVDVLLTEAAHSGRTDLLDRWHQDSSLKVSGVQKVAAYRAAVFGGHLDCLQWMHSHWALRCSDANAHTAASHGHLHILQWLHSNAQLDDPSSLLAAAAGEGRLVVLEWLFATFPACWSATALKNAASGGHLDVLQFLHQRRPTDDDDDPTESTPTALDCATVHGHLDVIIWLRDHGYQWGNAYPLDECLDLEVIQWLGAHAPSAARWSGKAILNAAMRGNLRLLEYYHQQRCGHLNPGVSVRVIIDKAVVGAARSGCLLVLAWLRWRYPQDFDVRAIRPFPGDHPCFLTWLREVRATIET